MHWWMLIRAASKTVQLMVVREDSLLGYISCSASAMSLSLLHHYATTLGISIFEPCLSGFVGAYDHFIRPYKSIAHNFTNFMLMIFPDCMCIRSTFTSSIHTNNVHSIPVSLFLPHLLPAQALLCTNDKQEQEKT